MSVPLDALPYGRSTGSRPANIKDLKSSPIYQEAKNLYRELNTTLGVQKQGH
jgi:hypothetical protein